MRAETLFRVITGTETGARGADAAAVDAREARNGLRHVAALSMSKIADGLLNPKLVLSWLLTSLGAPAVYAGALVPIREAGALLPQLFMAGPVAGMARRKWAWVAGSAGQGLAAAAIALAALSLQGAAAGLAICALLALLAVARALCSVSYKDILGDTVGETRRGAVTGLAGSAAALWVLGFALVLILGRGQSAGLVIGAVALAAMLWLGAAAWLARLEETAGQREAGAGGVDFALLRENATLRRFILVRGLLVSTALAPPYFVMLGGGEGGQLGRLGALVLASALASLVSSFIWGRAADRSSRKVLMASGALGALAMAAALGASLAGLEQGPWAIPGALFVLMIAYHGVRQGRSTYLVDIAPQGRRAAWAAVSNTAIGLILLGAGVAGGALAALGPRPALGFFAVMALAAVPAALRLEEAETG